MERRAGFDDRFCSIWMGRASASTDTTQSSAVAFEALERADQRGGPKPQVIIADTSRARRGADCERSLDWHVGNLVGEDYDDVLTETRAV